MGSKETCTACGGKVMLRYTPMKEWEISGTICGDCYSKKLNDHYPGDHVRINKDLD